MVRSEGACQVYTETNLKERQWLTLGPLKCHSKYSQA
jgi:hypothetical protein